MMPFHKLLCYVEIYIFSIFTYILYFISMLTYIYICVLNPGPIIILPISLKFYMWQTSESSLKNFLTKIYIFVFTIFNFFTILVSKYSHRCTILFFFCTILMFKDILNYHHLFSVGLACHKKIRNSYNSIIKCFLCCQIL